MKISVLTATYNRANCLSKLYESIITNLESQVDVEWLIMDDGSTDGTKEAVENLIKINKFEIKYFYQENQGKMQALNNLINEAQGDLIIECDSDDYFTDNAFKIIRNAYEKNKDNIKDFYALCFLKYDQTGNNMGNEFKKDMTTMFDLYFKQGECGEKALVFNSHIRKQYKYELENGEKFITEARMYHKMDEKYNLICINEPIMICEYQSEGYTRNINKQFMENPYGYFKYFKEIFEHDMKGVPFKKRLYVVKHYILFAVLSNQKAVLKQAKGAFNKVLIMILYLPGKMLTNKKFVKK